MKYSTTNPDDTVYPIHGDDFIAGAGLTKREAFMLSALQGSATNTDMTAEQIAEFAVMIADAAIEALNEQ